MKLVEREDNGSRTAAFLKALWLFFFFCTVASAAYLCLVCLLPPQGALARSRAPLVPPSPPAQNATPAPRPEATSEAAARSQADALATQSKVSALEGLTGEMSKRIEQGGNHATQVLNVIGLLIGFLTVVVAIGLWQSKQYIDRVVRYSKTEVEKLISERTDEQLKKAEAAVTARVKSETAASEGELGKRRAAALEELEGVQAEARANLSALSANQLEAGVRVGSLMLEQFANAVVRALDVATAGAPAAEGERADLKAHLKQLVWKEQQLLRALLQLESAQAGEVIAGSHTLAALEDRDYLPAMERAISRWGDKQDQRVVENLTAAYEKLISAREQAQH